MTETERNQIKGALFKCAEENENKSTLTGHIVVSSLCKSAVERIEELEKENAELKDKLEILIAVGNTCTKGLNKQLTKAKEIIEGLMRFCRCFAQHHTEDIRYKEAEQFLGSSYV